MTRSPEASSRRRGVLARPCTRCAGHVLARGRRHQVRRPSCRRCPAGRRAALPSSSRSAASRPSPGSAFDELLDLARRAWSAPGPCPARSCGRRSPCPGSRSCPRRGCRSWRRGCTARSGSPAGSRSRRRSAGDSVPSSYVGPLRAEALDDRQQQVVDPLGELVAARRGPRPSWTASWLRRRCRARAPACPSAYAFCVISERRTSGWWVMVTRGRGLVGHLREVGALDALLGVLEGVEVAGRQGRDRLRADHHAGELDDLEHLGDAVVHLAEQPADGRDAVARRRSARRWWRP